MQATTSGDLRELALGDVRPDPEQHRRTFDPEYIAGLAESIREHGQRTPIEVRPDPEDPSRWMIISGECRFRALSSLDAPTVRALVNDGLSGSDVAAIQGSENMARRDPLPTEEGRAHSRYIEALRAEEPHLSEEELRRRSGAVHGRRLQDVNRKLALLELPAEVGALVDAGAIGEGVALALLPLNVPEHVAELRRLAHRARANSWNVGATAAAVAAYLDVEGRGDLFGGEPVGGQSREARRTRDALARAVAHYERATAATFDEAAQGLRDLALSELGSAEVAIVEAKLRGAAAHLRVILSAVWSAQGREPEEVLGRVGSAEVEEVDGSAGGVDGSAEVDGSAGGVDGPAEAVCIRQEVRGSWLWVSGPGVSGPGVSSLSWALQRAGAVWLERRSAWYAPTAERRAAVAEALDEHARRVEVGEAKRA